MHVGGATDRRGVPQLSGDEAHRRRHVSFRLGDARWWAELREHGGGTERSAPRAEILGAERHAKPLVQVLVHVARGEVVPSAFVSIAKQPGTRRREVSLDQLSQFRIGDDLPLFHAALAGELEDGAAIVHLHVTLAQRRDAEGAVLLGITLAPNTEEALADQPDHRRRDRLLRRRSRRRVAAHALADARQVLRQLPHTIILAKLAPLHGTLVVAVLLASPVVEAPRLHLAARAGGDVDVVPPWRHGEPTDAVERARVTDAGAIGANVAECGFRSLTRDPFGHGVRVQGKSRSVGSRHPLRECGIASMC